MSASIVQEIQFEARPEQLYGALLDGAEFTRATGAPAEIDGRAGGAVSAFGGMITGRLIELVPGRRIVQAWRVGAWPDGVWSLVRVDLEPAGAGTRLTLEHSAWPEGAGEHLAAGWHANYWQPLRKHFA